MPWMITSFFSLDNSGNLSLVSETKNVKVTFEISQRNQLLLRTPVSNPYIVETVCHRSEIFKTTTSTKSIYANV